MVRTLFLFLVVCWSIPARAQTVNVSVLRDDPVHVKGAKILWDPLYVNTWKPNGHAGMGFGLLVNAGSLFGVEFNMRFAYKDHYHVKGDNSIPKFTNEELLLHWFFGKGTQPRIYKVKVSNTANGYTYVNQELKRRVAFGYRTGFSIISTGVQDAAIHSYYIKGADTNYLNGTHGYSVGMAVVGMVVKSVHNALVSLDGYRSAVGGSHEFYFDAMPLVFLDAGTVVPGYDTVSYDVHVPLREKLGWRFGWRFYDPSRSNFCFGMEIGTYAGPHYDKEPKYFIFRLGYAFGDKLKEQ